MRCARIAASAAAGALVAADTFVRYGPTRWFFVQPARSAAVLADGSNVEVMPVVPLDCMEPVTNAA